MTSQESTDNPAGNPAWTTASVRNVTVLLMTLVVSLLFVGVIRDYLMALLLAAIFAGIAQPVFRTVLGVMKGRRGVAAGVNAASNRVRMFEKHVFCSVMTSAMA